MSIPILLSPQESHDTHVARRPRSKNSGRGKLALGIGIIFVFVLAAILGPILTPYGPLAQDVANALKAPSEAHWFGTDELGRDVLSRVLVAASVDIPVALLATLLPMTLGTLLGLIAGYFGGWVDAITMRISDLLQAFPMYILMIVLVFIMGPGVQSLLISFTLIGWVVYARIARGEVVRVRSFEYISAAITGGLRAPRIIVFHVLPNTVRQTLLYFTSDLIFAVVALASFSFLGFGIQQPTPEWGSMIAAAQPYISVAWWLTVIPGAVLSLLALGPALVGDALQDRSNRR